MVAGVGALNLLGRLHGPRRRRSLRLGRLGRLCGDAPSIHSGAGDRRLRPAGPARGCPPARPHRRADAARCGARELLVPTPPGRVRVGRGALFGLRVVDMACGEGYGVEVLARRAREVTGVDANPEAHEHARLKYSRPAFASSATSSSATPSPATRWSSSRPSSTSRRHWRCCATSGPCSPTAGRPTSPRRTC